MELQDEYGTVFYNFGARNYDPALGRWMNFDPLSQKMRRHSSFNYAFYNPIFFIDPYGMAPQMVSEDEDVPPMGVLFGGVALGMDGATIGGAVALAMGIGLQNLPEGVAVAMPLRRAGMSRRKSFMYGQASAIVEPIAAVLGAWAVLTFEPILPYALAFAAGAMIFVVVEEVIPETQQDKHTDIATMGFIGGFILMMMLDVGLS